MSPALRRLRPEDHKFKASLGYMRPCLKCIIIIGKGTTEVVESNENKPDNQEYILEKDMGPSASLLGFSSVSSVASDSYSS